MNWYWPDWKNQKGIKRYILLFLNWFLNYVAKIIWFESANADYHDEWYREWKTEADRIRTDTWFLRYLLIDCKGVKHKIILAYVFYFAVRIFWYHFFFYEEWWKNKYYVTK